MSRIFKIDKVCGLIVTLALVAMAGFLNAKLKVDITEGIEGGIPIAVLSFAGQTQSEERTYSEIIASDLAYSGLFSLVKQEMIKDLILPTASSDTYAQWAGAEVEKIIDGRVIDKPDGRVLNIELYDVVVRKKIAQWEIKLQDSKVSAVAHHLSDKIYEELTGVVGIFSTRLAFISSSREGFRSRKYHLNIADADGYNIHTIFSSNQLLMSPVWSPDSKQIAYISYENGSSELFIQTLATEERRSLLKDLGDINSIDWSDDGSKFTYVSSRNGNPEIYVYDIPSTQVTRMTNNLSIDTEPSWAPNNTLYFTSDRSGSPQIYRIDPDQKEAQRISFEGNYNSDLDVSPRGDKIAYVSARQKQFTIIVRDILTSEEIALSFGRLEESPRFAPNGQLLSYLTQFEGQSALGLLTTDGVLGKIIPIKAPYIRAISWSPLK